MDTMPSKLGFQTKHILNPWSMQFNAVKVSLLAFVILFKILSAHCELTNEIWKRKQKELHGRHKLWNLKDNGSLTTFFTCLNIDKASLIITLAQHNVDSYYSFCIVIQGKISSSNYQESKNKTFMVTKKNWFSFPQFCLI